MSDMISAYERVTVILHGPDGKTRTVHLDGHYRPLIFEMSSKGHAVDVTSRNFVELQHVATTVHIELAGTIAKPEPWRFDVPEVPARVTALKGRYGNVWVRAEDGYWNRWSALQGKVAPGWRPVEAIFEEAPLVECPDPRAAS